VISGAGGGLGTISFLFFSNFWNLGSTLGHLAIQYAISGFGLRVIALDTGDEKKKLCSTLGAESFIDFKVCCFAPDTASHRFDTAIYRAPLM
jgi:D-arabinose 1-dehydrogenase-like Zn-dependent alcohol dehydrogenase